MKRILTIIMTIALVFAGTMNVNASEIEVRVYEFGDVTVTFDESCPYSEEKCSRIAHDIALGEEADGVQTYNLWCTLFGHDYETSVAYVVRHKVYSTAPRCLRDKYDVSVCARCDDTVKSLVRTDNYYCCE